MPLLWYKDPADGQFKPYVAPTQEEVEVGLTPPAGPEVELWMDTNPTGPGTDFDARYVKKSGDQMTGELIVGAPSATDPGLWLDGNPGRTRRLGFTTDGAARWTIVGNSTGEAGADAGTDLAIYRYSDAQVPTTALTISRATGAVRTTAALEPVGSETAAVAFSSGWSGSCTCLGRAGWVLVTIAGLAKSTAPAQPEVAFTVPAALKPMSFYSDIWFTLVGPAGTGGGLKSYAMTITASTGQVKIRGSAVPPANETIYGSFAYPYAV